MAMASRLEEMLIIYQDYTGETAFKSFKCMQSYNKTVMEANWDICTSWSGHISVG